MPDTYHIQISVYVKADTIYGAKAAASTLKGAIEGYADIHMGGLDEVIIDSVMKEPTRYDNTPDWLHEQRKRESKESSS